jgi:DNA-binding XRE family transcriptional regulator
VIRIALDLLPLVAYSYGMSNKKPGGPLGPHGDRKGGPPRGLAARIVKRRLALGLSQREAAEALGVNLTTIARWELGTEPRGLYRVVLDRWLSGRGE